MLSGQGSSIQTSTSSSSSSSPSHDVAHAVSPLNKGRIGDVVDHGGVVDDGDNDGGGDDNGGGGRSTPFNNYCVI